jgi:hypothetical protein
VIPQFAELAAIEQAVKSFANIFALTLLRKRQAGKADMWGMIWRNGLGWLAGLGLDRQDRIRRAMAAL